MRAFLSSIWRLDPSQRPTYEELHRAAEGGHVQVAEVLLKHGADAMAVDEEQRTPTQYAEEKGHRLLTTLLKKWEVDAQQEQARSAAAG